MSERLKKLLTPLSLSAFLKSFEDREYLFIARNKAGFYDEVMSVKDLDVYLQSGLLPAQLVNIVAGGIADPIDSWSRVRKLARGEMEACLPERLLQRYTDGATLILNAAHETIPALSVMCRELAREIAYPVQANVYMTPPNAQGFSRHHDDHEVLVLQLHGCKTWSVYNGKHAGPREVQLRDGDLLYIPRGMDHEASCASCGSIHITIGLYPTYGFQLVEELAIAAKKDPRFQRPAPLYNPQGLSHFEAEFAELMQNLVSDVPAPVLLERQFRAFIDSQSTGWRGRLSDLLRLGEVKPDTILCTRSDIARRLEPASDGVTLHFAGAQIAVPNFLVPSLNRILQDTEFAVRDLPGMMTLEGKLEFVRPFILKGLLAIIRI